jgi:hypothetical protein
MHTINGEPFEYAKDKSGLIAQVRQLAQENAELIKLCEQAIQQVRDLTEIAEQWRDRARQAEARMN